MTLIVNGEKHETDAAITVQALVDALGASGRRVAVMVNDCLVPRHRHATAELQDGDRIDVLSLVAGG